jgi:hypothetical protein
VRGVGAPGIDFVRVFEQLPGLFVLLDPDLKVVAASEDYLAATLATRDRIIGLPIFDAFPDNPVDPGGLPRIAASLDRVRTGLAPDTVAALKYAVPDGDGFTEKFWSVISAPVLGGDGVEAVVIRAEDVTELIDLRREASSGGQGDTGRLEEQRCWPSTPSTTASARRWATSRAPVATCSR